MSILFFISALFLVLLATGGFIVYIIKQEKQVYQWSYRILLAGFIFHTLFWVHQYYTLGVTPIISIRAAFSFFAWTIIGAYLLFHLKFKLMILGSFIAPFAACLMILSSTMPGLEVAAKPMFRNSWFTVHICTIFMGNGIFALTFITSIMYLIQENQIKKKKFGSFYKRLPSLESIDSLSHHALIAGLPLLTVGIITGAIYAKYILGTYWRWDPKAVWSLVTWLIYAILLHERLAVGWRGRKAAILSIVAFIVLLTTFIVVSLWLSNYPTIGLINGRALL